MQNRSVRTLEGTSQTNRPHLESLESALDTRGKVAENQLNDADQR